MVAWVWSLLWYLALDPLKWALAWVLNENGVRSSATWLREQVRACCGKHVCVLAFDSKPPHLSMAYGTAIYSCTFLQDWASSWEHHRMHPCLFLARILLLSAAMWQHPCCSLMSY